jgi:hypothetical protein
LSTLGLTSLNVLELKNALEGSLRVALPVSSFFEGASLSQLASRLLAELSAPYPPGLGALAGGDSPRTPLTTT